MNVKNTLHAGVLAVASLLPSNISAEEQKKPEHVTDEVLLKRLGDESYRVRESSHQLLIDRIQKRMEAYETVHDLPIIPVPHVASMQQMLRQVTENMYDRTSKVVWEGTQDADLERVRRSERILEECAERIDSSYLNPPHWIDGLQIDELPSEHPYRAEIIRDYCIKARKEVGYGSRLNYWKAYRHATKLLLDDLAKEAYSTRSVPKSIRYLHPDRSDMHLKDIQDLQDVFQPLYTILLEKNIYALDRRYYLPMYPSFPEDLVEEIRKKQGR